MSKKFTMLLASLFLTIGTAWAQKAATYADGLYKIYWQADQRGYLTYHADYPERPQLAGVVNHNPNGHYQLTDEGVNLGWYLYTSQTSGKSYLFEATTGKFITIKPGETVGNGKACVLETKVSTESQLTLMAADGNLAGTGYLFRYVIGNTNYHFCSGCGANKGNNPVRFSSDGQGDGGNRFVFADAGGLAISDDVKNAAIAKINAFENSAFNVTYKYFYGTTVWKTQEGVEVRPGEAFPVATAAPYGVTYTFPNDNVVPEDLTEGAEVIVTCTSTIAYATDFASIEHWYYMDLKDGKYLYYEEDQTHIPLTQTAVDANNRDAYSWAFVGNPFEGFMIVNKLAGSSMILSSSQTTTDGQKGATVHPILTSTPVPDGNNTYWVATASGYRTNGFYLEQKGYSSNKMNNRDNKLAYWNGGQDGGSTFVVKERDLTGKTELQAKVNTVKAANYTSGDAIGLLTQASVTAVNNAITAAETALAGEMTEAISEEHQAAINTAVAGLKVNAPAPGKYYRLKNIGSTNYMSVDGEAVKLLADGSKAASTIFYLDENNALRSYMTGKYLDCYGKNCSAENPLAGVFGAAHDGYRVNVVTYKNNGYWTYGAGADGAGLDRGSSTPNVEGYNWTFEKVEENDPIIAELNALAAEATATAALGYLTEEEKTALTTAAAAATAAATALGNNEFVTDKAAAVNTLIDAAMDVTTHSDYLNNQLFRLKQVASGHYLVFSDGAKIDAKAENAVSQAFSFVATETEGVRKYKLKSTNDLYMQKSGIYGYKAAAESAAADATDLEHEMEYIGRGQYNIKTTAGYIASDAINAESALWSNKAKDNVNGVWEIEPLEEVTVVYTLKLGEEVKKTEEHSRKYAGFSYPEVETSYFGVTATGAPTGIIAEGVAVDGLINKDITLAVDALPFVPAEDVASVENWYYLRFHASHQNYLYYAADGEVLDATKTAVDANDKDAYTWAFIGNPFDGFKLYNKKAGKYLDAGESGAMVSATEQQVFTLSASSYAAHGFFMQARDGDYQECFNKQGNPAKVVYWDDVDGGSTFVVEKRLKEGFAAAAELLEANENNHADEPGLGQYTTTAYNALKTACEAADATTESVEEAIAEFKASLNSPVYLITSAWDEGYSAGSAIYYDGSSWRWKKASLYDRQMWMTIPGHNAEEAPVVDAYNEDGVSYKICDYSTGTVMRGKEVQIVEVPNWDGGGVYSLQYAPETNANGLNIDAAQHAADHGGLVNWAPALHNDRKASAWRLEYIGSTYELKDLTDGQLTALAGAEAAFDSKIFLYGISFGNGIGEYQGDDKGDAIRNTLTEMGQYLSRKLNVLAEKSVDDINAWTTALNNIVVPEINLPAEGQYYRIYGANSNVSPSGCYISSHTNADGGRIALTAGADASTIYYYSGGKLQAYQGGKYLGVSSTNYKFADSEETASEITFAGSSYVVGAYSIKSADRYLRYKVHNGSAELDRTESEASANDAWYLSVVSFNEVLQSLISVAAALEAEADGQTGNNPGEYQKAAVTALATAIDDAEGKLAGEALLSDIETLQDAIDNVYSNIVPVTAGLYRIVSANASFGDNKRALTAYATNVHEPHKNPGWAPVNVEDPLQYWSLEAAADGKFYIKGADENYITTVSSMTTEAKAAEFIPLGNTQYNIELEGAGAPLHCNMWNWGVDAAGLVAHSAGVSSASAWTLVKVTETPEFTYELNVTSLGYATLMLAYNAVIPVGITCNAVAVSGNRVNLNPIEGDVLPANTPVVVELQEGYEAGVYAFESTTTAAAVDVDNELEGTLYPKLITPGATTCYILANKSNGVGFYRVTLDENDGAAFLNTANRVYLPVPVVEQGAPAMFSFGRGGEGTTSIEDAELTNDNGQLTIYDLTGRRLTEIVEKGIYIVNGRKVVIK